jgi:hypothetical protein
MFLCLKRYYVMNSLITVYLKLIKKSIYLIVTCCGLSFYVLDLFSVVFLVCFDYNTPVFEDNIMSVSGFRLGNLAALKNCVDLDATECPSCLNSLNENPDISVSSSHLGILYHKVNDVLNCYQHLECALKYIALNEIPKDQINSHEHKCLTCANELKLPPEISLAMQLFENNQLKELCELVSKVSAEVLDDLGSPSLQSQVGQIPAENKNKVRNLVLKICIYAALIFSGIFFNQLPIFISSIVIYEATNFLVHIHSEYWQDMQVPITSRFSLCLFAATAVNLIASTFFSVIIPIIPVFLLSSSLVVMFRLCNVES